MLDARHRFPDALGDLLEVLPVSHRFTKVALQKRGHRVQQRFRGALRPRSLAYAKEVAQPKQLELWLGEEGIGDPA